MVLNPKQTFWDNYATIEVRIHNVNYFLLNYNLLMLTLSDKN